ncbi:uncharacterized protein LOC129912233 [Episyrphus balteatus]|uniref:uncharacterized protein LOC129912233 n=1 Tax=Episyrphus balteatus TaxID=286459 RepID=UPI002486ACFB|nr:uncharacterized protein LOC129912233 [Episyrphus balteatus]XP_055846360.1 uncharacterized protein LOC129912233 [Episyrphus balteatus]
MKNDLRTSLSQADIESQHSIKVLPTQKPKLPKNKNLNKNYLDVNFIAPDGGWGWIVVIAAAISILVTHGGLKQWEILFRFEAIGNESFQFQTILNIELIAYTCTGLFIGEIFRRFTFRQISLFGSVLTFLGIALSVFAESLTLHFLPISILCGIGHSLIFSASHITVLTYFDEKRISAIACMYAISGFGPIFLNTLTNYLLGEHGFTYTILFYAALSLHNFASSFLYHPVKRHLNKPDDIELMDQVRPLNLIFGSRQIRKLNALEIPMDSNDDLTSQRSFPSNLPYPLRVPKNSCASFAPLRVARPTIPKIILPDETEYFESPQEFDELSDSSEDDHKKLTILQRISKFFDLDLLKDFSFVNTILGLAIINFVENNFTLLAGSVLKNHDFDKSEESVAILVLTVCDMVMRMSIPLFAKYLKCSNKAIFLCALMGMCIGRAILVFSRNFTVVLVCFGWMGLCKAIRIIFWILILPSYVPLKKLPAAIGLQEVICGIFSLVFGQFLVVFRNASISGFLLHGINIICLIVAFSWLGEDLFKRKRIKLQIN